MHTQLENLLLFSRVNVAQHVSGKILPIIRSTFKLQLQPPVAGGRKQYYSPKTRSRNPGQ
jgi:hypothetical protein